MRFVSLSSDFMSLVLREQNNRIRACITRCICHTDHTGGTSLVYGTSREFHVRAYVHDACIPMCMRVNHTPVYFMYTTSYLRRRFALWFEKFNVRYLCPKETRKKEKKSKEKKIIIIVKYNSLVNKDFLLYILLMLYYYC